MFIDSFSEKEIKGLVFNSLSFVEKDVERCLSKRSFSLSDLPILLSPSASKYLETMASISADITRQRFGYVMQLYAPLYLSNECFNHCSYCGFGIQHDYIRKTLNDDEILQEVDYLVSRGISHILLLTGESPKTVVVDYIAHALDLIILVI